MPKRFVAGPTEACHLVRDPKTNSTACGLEIGISELRTHLARNTTCRKCRRTLAENRRQPKVVGRKDTKSLGVHPYSRTER